MNEEVFPGEDMAVQSVRSLMFILNDEHPATVYTAEGYEIWLRATAREILRQSGLVAENKRMRHALTHGWTLGQYNWVEEVEGRAALQREVG